MRNRAFARKKLTLSQDHDFRRFSATATAVRCALERPDRRKAKLSRIERLFLLARVVFVMALAAASHSAKAARLEVSRLGSENAALIAIEGELVSGDEKKFANIAISYPDAIVAFRSDGGNLLAGIEIGKAIRLKGYSTVVPNGTRCASACALAWLGGRVRFMSASALVGFHAAFVKPEREVTSSGNALVGAYLNQLGLPMTAIVYLTEASPHEMRWLTFADAGKVGIDVRPLELPVVAAREAARERPEKAKAGKDKVAQTRAFVSDYWSELNSDFPALLRYYAGDVEYFGVHKPAHEVLKEKAAFFKRWPRRAYAIEPGSPNISCEGDLCTASGLVGWDMSNGAKNSVGRASFELRVDWTTGNPQISYEISKVETRRIRSLARAPESAASYPFDKYNAGPIYAGSPRLPEFAGRDRPFANYRTRIRDGMRGGANFAGRYALIQVGCGAGCSFVLMGDVSNGKVYAFPRGGEENQYLQLYYKTDSALIVARWAGDGVCYEESFVWRPASESFGQVAKRIVGDEDACVAGWPPG